MRRFRPALVIAFTVACVTVAQADLLWDNFLTADPRVDGGFDGHSYFSSENNAAVEDTWATDDAIFNQAVTLQGIKWAGGRDPNWDYSVEVIILEENTPGSFSERPGFPLAVQDYQVLDTFGTFYGLEVYNGYVEIPDTPLPAGHYYIGVRLVSGPGGQGDGRNVALTTGDGTLNGNSMGLVRPGPAAYYDWMFIEDFPGETATDYAFQIYGIPEPAAIVLLAVGFVILRRP